MANIIAVPTTFAVTPQTVAPGESFEVSIVLEHSAGSSINEEFNVSFTVDGVLQTIRNGSVTPAAFGDGVEEVSFTFTPTEEKNYSVKIQIPEADNRNTFTSTVVVTENANISEEEVNRRSARFNDTRSPVTITNITAPESNNETVTFGKYDQPDISVDTGVRYSKHEVVGGPTVRQKVGEDPTEISINGVCTEEVANQIDLLKFEDTVGIESSRISLPSLNVTSTSTQPHSEGGSMDYNGEFIFTFSISLVEAN